MKKTPNFIYDTCLGLMWTAIKGGNISFTRAQQENIRLQKKAANFAISEWFEISADLSGPETIQLPAIISPKGSEFFFCYFAASLPPAADRYLTLLMITVGIESHQALITFSVLERQGDLSLLLDITRKKFSTAGINSN